MRLKLYKGGVYMIGRDSPHSLYDQDLVTFEEGAVAYDHNDAAGLHQAQRAAPEDAGEAEEEGKGVGPSAVAGLNFRSPCAWASKRPNQIALASDLTRMQPDINQSPFSSRLKL